MKIGQDGLKLIKEFEGLRLTAYTCAAGVLTIGYGSTGPHVKRGMKISHAEAEALLRKDLERFEKAVNDLVKVPLTQSMFDAVVSFTFNCGAGALRGSRLLRLLNQEDYTAAAAQFDRWVNGPNGTLPGLVRRRNAEEALFRKEGLNPKVRPIVSYKKFKIKAKVNTLLKKGPGPGSDLAEDEKVIVQAGKEFSVVWRGKEDNSHVKISLDYSMGNWYVFAPHWEGLDGTSPPRNEIPTTLGSKLLSTPYFSQRDNIVYGNDMPWRTCFSSSCAMLAVTVKPGCVTGDDDYIAKRRKYGDSTSASAQVKCLNSLGIKARFITNGTNDLIKKQIDRGIPVPCGILHHGPASAPTGGGHWICVVGYNSSGFIVNDPWGQINHINGTYTKTDGKHVHYDYELFDIRWTVERANDGWAIVVD